MHHTLGPPYWIELIFTLMIPALLVVGALVGAVVLAVNRKTRPWALGLLGVMAVATLLFGTVFVTYRASGVPRQLRLQGHQMYTPPVFDRTVQEQVLRAEQTKASRMHGLILAPIVIVIGLGLLAGVVYLLINPNTRSVLLSLLGAMAAFALLLVVGWVHTGVSPPAKTPPPTVRSTAEQIPPGSALPLADSGNSAVSVSAVEDPGAETAAEERGSKGLLHAVGMALGEAVAAARKTAGQESVPETSAALSTAPAVEMSPERPDWVDREADRNEKGDFQMPVYVGPYATREECHNELPNKLLSAVGDYAAGRIGPQARGRIRLPLDYIQDHIVSDRWEEWKEFEPPLGKMVKLHVLLKFDRQANARIDEEWNHVVVGRRLGAVAAAGLLLLVLLSTAWAYLKIDLATGGARRGRLRLGAAAVVLALVAAVALLFR